MPRFLAYLHGLVLLISLLLASAAALDQRAPAGVPSYVISYAPLTYLYSGENYFPADISTHLLHTQPEVNFTVVPGAPCPLTPSNLDALNALGDRSIFLTSKDDITTDPAWLRGTRPDAAGVTTGATTSAIIVNDRGNSNVDAFYFYFFSYDYGGTFLGRNLGNHVGDWEHNMIRFTNGVPAYVWYSQHAYGQAFLYSVLRKSGQRPLAYMANGSHALYAIPGPHDHTFPNLNLPFGFLVDYTDAGVLYDPTASAWYYQYNASSNTFTAYDPTTPTAWLYYLGQWGDQEYPDSDPRQDDFFGVPKYAGGTRGPIDKDLNRTDVCPSSRYPCIRRAVLSP